jgi:hypothetical protein
MQNDGHMGINLAAQPQGGNIGGPMGGMMGGGMMGGGMMGGGMMGGMGGGMMGGMGGGMMGKNLFMVP